MKVLVCGGRDYSDHEELYSYMDAIHGQTPITCVIHGGAKGADTLAGIWAVQNNLPVVAYPADWKKHGRAAGPIRNKQMLDDNPDIARVIAFKGGKGTLNMITLSVNRTIPVQKVG